MCAEDNFCGRSGGMGGIYFLEGKFILMTDVFFLINRRLYFCFVWYC